MALVPQLGLQAAHTLLALQVLLYTTVALWAPWQIAGVHLIVLLTMAVAAGP